MYRDIWNDLTSEGLVIWEADYSGGCDVNMYALVSLPNGQYNFIVCEENSLSWEDESHVSNTYDSLEEVLDSVYGIPENLRDEAFHQLAQLLD